MRTGDTPQRERARFARHPADILITTPESLYLLLTSQASEALRTVDTVIIDEIHALVPTKRGAHLALSLERLEALTKRRLQRIGLSATQRPLEEVARFLGGVESAGPEPAGEGKVSKGTGFSADMKPMQRMPSSAREECHPRDRHRFAVLRHPCSPEDCSFNPLNPLVCGLQSTPRCAIAP